MLSGDIWGLRHFGLVDCGFWVLCGLGPPFQMATRKQSLKDGLHSMIFCLFFLTDDLGGSVLALIPFFCLGGLQAFSNLVFLMFAERGFQQCSLYEAEILINTLSRIPNTELELRLSRCL